MRARDIMTKNPVFCTPDMPLIEAAELLLENGYGAVPVVEDLRTRQPVGIVTDRDIACRCVSKGLLPCEASVCECMSAPAVTVAEDAEIAECVAAMEAHHFRRVVVVDGAGCCCGIVSQADIERYMGEKVWRTSTSLSSSRSRPLS